MTLLFITGYGQSIPEHTLLKLLTKYGPIKRFTYIWHTTGPLRGKPKGFSFVEYETEKDTLTVLENVNGFKIGQVSLVVKVADQPSSTSQEQHTKPLSTIKTSKDVDKPVMKQLHGTNDDKIKALERKLADMKNPSTRHRPY